MRYGEYPKRTAIFFLLDTIPEYIQRTFGVSEQGRLLMPSDTQFAVLEGEMIPDRLDGAVIVYHASEWHMTNAARLTEQIEDMQPKCLIMGIAVYQG